MRVLRKLAWIYSGNRKAEAVGNHHEGFPIFNISLDSERNEMRGITVSIRALTCTEPAIWIRCQPGIEKLKLGTLKLKNIYDFRGAQSEQAEQIPWPNFIWEPLQSVCDKVASMRVWELKPIRHQGKDQKFRNTYLKASQSGTYSKMSKCTQV